MSELAPGSRLGPYEILTLLGRGGMGEVWKARDARLNRIVAIKRLKPEHAARFEREARAIAALNHPHICQIHDIGPDFLVLEYVDGSPLQGPMAAAAAVRLALQIAGALEAAHERGILHRDLKPANVIVAAGRGGSATAQQTSTIKLLDFGISTSISSDPAITSTFEGMPVGTVAYMSPEQAQGKPLDARSDVFSFGAVLYEMLTGRRAFAGSSTAQTLSLLLRDDPAPLRAPPVLDGIVRRCLAKNPVHRFRTMSDVREALEQVASLPSDIEPSIAVLPFASLSPARDDEYFGDGLAEEIINALAQIPGLKVIARTSAFAFKNQNTDVRRIGETLGVTHILEGSVRRSGSRLRVTAQLITAGDGSNLWSQRFDCELADIFDMQDDITHAITAALRVRLAGAPVSQRRLAGTPAYDAFLQGRYFLAKESPEAFEISRRHMEEAIALEPEFALAHSWLSALHVYFAGFMLHPAREAMPLARIHAQRAVELAPSLSEAHSLLGVVAAAFDYDWTEAARCFRLAMAGDAVSPLTRFNYGLHYLIPLGRAAEAVDQIERGLRDDPLNTVRHTHAAVALAAAGRIDDAMTAARRALELDHRSWIALLQQSMLQLSRGNVAAAQRSTQEAFAIAPWSFSVAGMQAAMLARSGQTGAAEHFRQSLGTGAAPGAPLGLTEHYLLLQDIDQAAHWASKSIEQRDLIIPFLLRQPIADTLRTSSHWPSLAAMMKLPATPS